MACFQSLFARRLLLWYILIFSIVILPLSWDITMGCSLVLVGPADDSRKSLKGFGLFSNAVYDEDGSFLGCVDYSQYWSNETDDKGFKMGRVFGGLLGASITLASFICLLVQCFNKHGKASLWAVMKWSYAAAFLCQGLIFTVWISSICEKFEGEDSRCVPGRNGIASMVNMAFLLFMVVATFNSPPPLNPVFRCWNASETDYDTDKADTDDDGSDPENPKSENKSRALGRQNDSDEQNANDSVSLFGGSKSTKRQHSQRSNYSSSSKSLTSKKSISSKKSVGSKGTAMQEIQEDQPFTNEDSKPNIIDAGSVTSRSTMEPLPSTTSRGTVQRQDPPVNSYFRRQQRRFNQFDDKSNRTDQTSSVNDESTIGSTLNEGWLHSKGTATAIAEDRPIEAVMCKFGDVNQESAKEAARITKDNESVQSGTSKRSSKEAARITKDNESAQSGTSKRSSKEAARITKDNESAQSGTSKRSSKEAARITKDNESAQSGTSTRSSKEVARITKDNESVLSGTSKRSSKSTASNKSGKPNSKEQGDADGSTSSYDKILLQRLGRSVVLGKGGVRICEEQIGKTLKIVDEYPAGKNGKSQNSQKSDGSAIVKVRTEYCSEGRKTIKEEVHPNGSRSIITLIDPAPSNDRVFK